MTQLYATEDSSHFVEVADTALSAILTMCQSAQSVETGGILIGSYSDEQTTASVREALGPPDGSRSNRTSFERGTKGLAGALRERWPVGQHYVGEWHFHPAGTGGPSSQDIRQMTEISLDPAYDCSMPILIIVAGRGGHMSAHPWIGGSGEAVRLTRTTQGKVRGFSDEQPNH